jgi:hypothetical protein
MTRVLSNIIEIRRTPRYISHPTIVESSGAEENEFAIDDKRGLDYYTFAPSFLEI